MKLLLRPTVITDEKLQDDYCVFHEGVRVGRIKLPASGRGRVSCGSGTSTRLSRFRHGAMATPKAWKPPKVKFKAAWERFYASLTPNQLDILQRTA